MEGRLAAARVPPNLPRSARRSHAPRLSRWRDGSLPLASLQTSLAPRGEATLRVYLDGGTARCRSRPSKPPSLRVAKPRSARLVEEGDPFGGGVSVRVPRSEAECRQASTVPGSGAP